MARTRADLVYRTLKCLGALPQGQDPGDEEYNQVDDLIDSVIAELRVRDVYFLPDVDAIPDEAFLCLGHVMAWACAPDFGQEGNQNLYLLGQQAEKYLETMQSEGPYYTTLEVQAY